MGKWRRNSTHSKPWHYTDVSVHLHCPAALPWGKSPQYPFDKRLGVPQSQSEHGGKEKNSQPLPGIEPWSSNP